METAEMPDNSSFSSTTHCSNSTAEFVLGKVFVFSKAVCHIPLSLFILYLGVQQWRPQRSFKKASHSDIFTYHSAAFELLWFLAVILTSRGIPPAILTKVANFLFSFSWYGPNFLHVLTCVERYLAVVCPVVYMRLRNERGVRIRNISIVCVWILSTVCSSIISLTKTIGIPFIVPFAFCFVVVSFCSLSVLYVLIRPRPGEGVQDRGWVDQTKRRAFFTITVILVVLSLWLGGLVLSYILFISPLVSNDVKCLAVWCSYLLNVPSGLILPLLYLHRAGKLPISGHKNGKNGV